MKKLILIVLVLNLTSLINGQNSIKDITKDMTIANGKISYIFNLDVFSYFNLKDYDTPLKQEVFKKTEEYLSKNNELLKLKNSMFYEEWKDMFSKVQYNIEKKGFNLFFCNNANNHPPKSLDFEYGEYGDFKIYVFLKSLPSYKETAMWKNLYQEYLYIPMNETDALEIENNKDLISVYFIFKLDGLEKVKYQTIITSRPPPFETYILEKNLVKSDQVRIIVVNRKTDKIYYDNTYLPIKENPITKKNIGKHKSKVR